MCVFFFGFLPSHEFQPEFPQSLPSSKVGENAPWRLNRNQQLIRSNGHIPQQRAIPSGVVGDGKLAPSVAKKECNILNEHHCNFNIVHLHKL